MPHPRSETTIDSRSLYMVTISSQQKKDYISKVRIDEVILWLKYSIKSLHVIQSVYETSGKYRQLHWHALVSCKKIRYAPYTSWGDKDLTGNTYRIQWKKVYNEEGAINYINKDLRHQTQEDILLFNYYSVNRF